eukprot:COSAG01_NODE_2955_length_6799_cov_5.722090_3_plen_198_part_00
MVQAAGRRGSHEAAPARARGAAAVASFCAAVLTEIYLCSVCSCQEILRRNGRGQGGALKRARAERRALQKRQVCDVLSARLPACLTDRLPDMTAPPMRIPLRIECTFCLSSPVNSTEGARRGDFQRHFQRPPGGATDELMMRGGGGGGRLADYSLPIYRRCSGLRSSSGRATGCCATCSSCSPRSSRTWTRATLASR